MSEFTDRRFLFVSETEPDLPNGWEYDSFWLKPSIGIYQWSGSNWALKFAPLMANPSELGNINFIGTVSADGSQGLTGQRTIQGYTLTFKKGLLTGFQAP